MQSLTELPNSSFSLAILIRVILVLLDLVWCFKGWRVRAVVVRTGGFQRSSPVLWYRWFIRLQNGKFWSYCGGTEGNHNTCGLHLEIL